MKFVVLVVFGLFLNQAFAQTSSTTLTPPAQSSGSFKSVIEKVEVQDPQIITDKKLQADEGSLSKYSLKFSLSYSGPGIGDLENKNQPNPDGTPGKNETKITGSMGGKYRIDGRRTIALGTGVSAIHPMHGWERTDVNNPYLSYDISSKWNELQVRNMFSASAITTPEYRKIGEVASASYEINTVQRLSESRVSAGFDAKFDYYFYEREYRKSDNKKAAQNYLSFYPNLKYQISDKSNINTSVAIMFYNPRRLDDRWALLNRTVTQRVGFGYSYRRDVYFSPYLTLYPDDLKAKNTTFNLSATFSML